MRNMHLCVSLARSIISNGRTARQTDEHTMTAYIALAYSSRGKNQVTKETIAPELRSNAMRTLDTSEHFYDKLQPVL